jgi:hypothetical protein
MPVALAGCASYSGAVVDTNGNPVPGADVTLMTPSSKKYGFDVFKKTTTDSHGKFVLESFQEGELLTAKKGEAFGRLEPATAGDHLVIQIQDKPRK